MPKQDINYGSAYNKADGEKLRDSLVKAKSNFDELYGRLINGADAGAVADGSTSLNTAISAAISAGYTTFVLDEGPSFYRLTGTVTMPANFKIVAGLGRPTIKMDSALTGLMFLWDNVMRSGLVGLRLDGNNTITPSTRMAWMRNGSLYCFMRDVECVNLPSADVGSIIIDGTTTSYNTIQRCRFTSSEGTCIGVWDGVANDIVENEFYSSGSFSIRLVGKSSRNLVAFNKSFSSGLEAIQIGNDAITFGQTGNRIAFNHCESAGDNGISVTGRYNVVEGNHCVANQKAGIGLWGSRNSIIGNICINNNQLNTSYWSGIWVQANYGVTGQSNVISGNVCDDFQATPTQAYGISLNGSGYPVWASGQTIGVQDGTIYRVSGLNVYYAASAGTTGASPPTHTSGTVSDGGVSWTYRDSFDGAVGTFWNIVTGNVVRISKTASYSDVDNWQRSVLVSDVLTSFSITSDGLVRAKAL